MHPYRPKPHVSPALAHLRFGVTAAALALAVFSMVQLLVFGFVHFTDVRWVASEAREAGTQSLRVVTGGAAGQVAVAKGTTPEPERERAPEPRRQLGTADPMLHAMSDFAVSGGVAAAALLWLFAAMGVVVGGASAVPGVDRAVSASMWASLLLMGCMPWQGILPSVPWAGVFGPYAAMSKMSIAVNGGGGSTFGLLAQFFLMPLAAMMASFLVLYRFRAGIAEGIIVTSVSELDDRLEREMATIRTRAGAVQPAARAVAALNSAIGEAPVARPARSEEVEDVEYEPPEPPPRRVPSAAPPREERGKGGRSWMTRDRRMGESDPGDPLKRPI